jgi:hypothetical protein
MREGFESGKVWDGLWVWWGVEERKKISVEWVWICMCEGENKEWEEDAILIEENETDRYVFVWWRKWDWPVKLCLVCLTGVSVSFTTWLFVVYEWETNCS